MLIERSSYRAPWWLRNGHLNTIYPSLFRKLHLPFSARETIDTDDQDLLCLDWYRINQGASNRKLVIVSHGLEGHSERPYVLGMCRKMNAMGYDALAWNFRSCGPFMNRQKRFYHSGATEDLAQVIEHAQKDYDHIALVGFSMGGNLSLLHCGREHRSLDPKVRVVVGVSVPCDLEGCAYELAKRENQIYMKRFLKDLRSKMHLKHSQFPDIPTEPLARIKNFQEFDDLYTAPLHGFDDAQDYWNKSSCLGYLDQIQIPALVVNAKDDPFLSESAYPYSRLESLDHVYLETPEHGGHVGFVSFQPDGSYWIEQRVAEFLATHF
ncbi:YheT family hydrolase [Litoribrevibacter albus]|uniref:Alpha/beta hydrolase n=1 Tax=Litoribrevibacter albus TaxID=1473156 RepID=A0AA37SAE0_9GAMM|nr:alpha/beta fold hydrolase [Litoribrevibacter albus]GLQ31325.1 alpha/beta hydrolase [Litoribrevibacter albus]